MNVPPLLAYLYDDMDGMSPTGRLVVGIFMVLVLYFAIVGLDKVLSKGERKISDDRFPNDRSFLRMLDFFVSTISQRPMRMDQPAYRKSTRTEKRVGTCALAFIPFFMMLTFKGSGSKQLDGLLDTMIYNRPNALWLELGCAVAGLGFIFVGVVFFFKIAPRIPLPVSVPIPWPFGW
jgi:hypothetical protein